MKATELTKPRQQVVIIYCRKCGTLMMKNSGPVVAEPKFPKVFHVACPLCDPELFGEMP